MGAVGTKKSGRMCSRFKDLPDTFGFIIRALDRMGFVLYFIDLVFDIGSR